MSVAGYVLLAIQGAACLLLVSRLLPGRTRRPPIPPLPSGLDRTSVTVLLPAFNEAQRITPCLEGLSRQGPPLIETLVIDSGSTDGTRDIVARAALADPRIQLLEDPPLPVGWVGKVWALQHGLAGARGEWVLGVDADIEPHPGMVAAVVHAAQQLQYDVVSFSPRFAAMTTAEQWLQPSMLLTLVYRFGASGLRSPPPHRVMANGQCFLAKRSVLEAHGGYAVARTSWADDVTLARALARAGVAVGFLDGSRLYNVRAYTGLAQMWSEWGRSFDLKDATSRTGQWVDVGYVVLVQGLPLPLVIATLVTGAVPSSLVALNLALIGVRVFMTFVVAGSYARRSAGFWLSFTSDPVAAVRLVLSSLKRPRQWRGRVLRTPEPPAN